jgi:hypothetical protein
MASPSITMRRLARPILALALVAVALAQVGVADAYTGYAITGKHGRSRILDSATNPGASCYYDANGSLYRIRVDPPLIWAHPDYGTQPASFRARDQWLFADGRQDVISSSSAFYRYSAQRQATVDVFANLERLDIQFRLNPGARGIAFVDLAAHWHNPHTRAIEAARAVYLEHYHRYQSLGDGRVVALSDAFGGCRARLG